MSRHRPLIHVAVVSVYVLTGMQLQVHASMAFSHLLCGGRDANDMVSKFFVQ